MLDIVIIGAGVAGLSAAIGLAPAGHRIRILERAETFRDEGNGIHMIASANRVLHNLGIDASLLRASELDTLFSRRAEDAGLLREQDLAALRKELGLEYADSLMDRAALHKALLTRIRAAPNVDLQLGVSVASIESHGSVCLRDGTRLDADLVIGSDGMHSLAYKTFPHLDDPTYISTPRRLPSRLNSCAVDPKKAREDPLVEDLFREIGFNQHGRGSGFYVDKALWGSDTPGHDQFSGSGYIFLPIQNRTSLCVISFRPLPEAKSDMGPWTTNIPPEQYLEDIAVEKLAPVLQSVVRQGRRCERWTLGIRDCPTTFVNDKVVVIGDAAHPVNPSLGAGSGIGIEDGACLGVLLETATKANLDARLKIFNDLRYTHCVGIKFLSEITRPPGTGTSEEMFKRLCPGAPVPSPQDIPKLLGVYDVMAEARAALESQN